MDVASLSVKRIIYFTYYIFKIDITNDNFNATFSVALNAWCFSADNLPQQTEISRAPRQ